MPDHSSPYRLTREVLLADEARRLMCCPNDATVRSNEALDESLRKTLAQHPAGGGDVWLFGYGSLIWNPAFHFAESHTGRVYGWHRQFCLWAFNGRGSPERPGLVLGLKAGGSCAGVAFRIPAQDVLTELGVVWRREMISGIYEPRWVEVHRPGEGRVQALTFVTNLKHPHYTGRLDGEQVAQALATASGHLGPCAEYFFSTLHALHELGIQDPGLRALRDRVLTLKHSEARVGDYKGMGT